MLVQQILKSKANDTVISVEPGTKVSKVVQVLAEHRIGAVLVSEDGKTIQGILSERDIVRAMAASGTNCINDSIEDIMTRDPVCCSRNDSAVLALQRMTEGRFRHMPVVDEGVMVGLVTIGDVVKARLAELSMEKDALEGMIMGR